MYKLNKESVDFLYDNDLLTVKYLTPSPNLIQELSYISEYLKSNVVDLNVSSQQEPIQVYSTMLLPVIEYHVNNAVTINTHYEMMCDAILQQSCSV